jgi:hypothetical protein
MDNGTFDKKKVELNLQMTMYVANGPPRTGCKGRFRFTYVVVLEPKMIRI